MERFSKKKEAIRNQIQVKAKHYRKYRDISFFEGTEPNSKYTALITDERELPALLIRYSFRKKILVTTQHLFFIKGKSSVKIHGRELDRYDYMEHINYGAIYKTATKFRRMLYRPKIIFRIGKYRIVKKDGTHVNLFFTRTRHPDCLNECIKRLKFVTDKYEVI